MPRKPKPAAIDWTPNPDCAEAFARIIDAAHRCAAEFTRTRPVADPTRDAAPVALHHAMAMVGFLARIDPADLRALSTGPGSFADFAHRPFPPLRRRRAAAGAPADG